MAAEEEKKNENNLLIKQLEQVIKDAEEITRKHIEMMEKSPDPLSHAFARSFIDISIARLLYYSGIPENERKKVDNGQKNLDIESIPFIITMLSLELAWLVAYYRFNHKRDILPELFGMAPIISSIAQKLLTETEKPQEVIHSTKTDSSIFHRLKYIS